MAEKELDTFKMADELNAEVLRLRAVNTQLLEALENIACQTCLQKYSEPPRKVRFAPSKPSMPCPSTTCINARTAIELARKPDPDKLRP